MRAQLGPSIDFSLDFLGYLHRGCGFRKPGVWGQGRTKILSLTSSGLGFGDLRFWGFELCFKYYNSQTPKTSNVQKHNMFLIKCVEVPFEVLRYEPQMFKNIVCFQSKCVEVPFEVLR